jgi:hypothetical protein
MFTATAGNYHWQYWGAYGYIYANGAKIWDQPAWPPPHPGFPSRYSTIDVHQVDYVINHDVNGRGSLSLYGIWGTKSNPIYNPDTGVEYGMPPAETAITYSTANGSLTDYARVPLWTSNPPPSTPPTPTVTRMSNGATDYLDLLSPLAVRDGGSAAFPAITKYQYRMSITTAADITKATWYDLVDVNVPKNIRLGRITNLDPTKTYYFQTRAVNSEGTSIPSSTRTAYPAPILQNVQRPSGLITTIPPLAYPGLAYVGKVSATGVNSKTPPYSVSSGSLPPGITLNTSSGDITGVPTLPGLYEFQLTATGPGGSIESDPQRIIVAAAGPWVKVTDVTKTITEAAVSVVENVATATVKAVGHGITYYNQPITISGVDTGGNFALLNGTFSVISRTTDTVSFIVNTPDPIPTETISGTLTYGYTPTVIKVRQGDLWKQAYMRVYDSSYTASDGTHWRPTF